MYKVKHGLVPDYISRLFEKQHQHYNLRITDSVIPRIKTVDNGTYSTRYYESRLWSILSMCNREKSGLSFFRTSIRK